MIHGWPRVRHSPGSNPAGTIAGTRCTSGRHFTLISLLPCRLELSPSLPNSPTRLFLPALDPLASIHLLSPSSNFLLLLRDLQERLAGEPKSRFTLSRHKWKIRAREVDLMQEWLGFSKKHWIDGLALRQKPLPSPPTPAPPPHPAYTPVWIQRPRLH